MRQKPIDFIHIGMGKCASTYLQNVFHKDPDFNLFDIQNILGLTLEKSRQGAEPEDFPNVNISFDPSLLHGIEKYNVSSAEGFSFVNEPAHYQSILHLYKLSAYFLGSSQLSSKILLMIRNPIEWLRAAHEQYIKGGGYCSYEEYFIREKEYLKNSLNINEIIKIYATFFDVITLSADHLRSDPEGFWDQFSRELNVGVPQRQIRNEVLNNKQAANPTLKDRNYKLSIINKHSAAKLKTLKELSDYFSQIPDEAEASLKYCENEMWINRRIVEYASETQLDELMSQFKGVNQSNFTKIFIDISMKDHLLRNFIEPLKKVNTISTKLVDSYVSSIDASVA